MRALVLAMGLPIGMAFGKQPGRKFGMRPSERAAIPYRPPTQRDYNRLAAIVTAEKQKLAEETGVSPIGGEDPAGDLPPLDAAELRSRLPAAIGDLRQVKSAGESDEDSLPVVGHYVNADRTRTIKITLCDIDGGVPGASREEIERARSTTINQETPDGYIRTREIAGYMALVQSRRSTRTGEIVLVAGERVGVHVLGEGVDMSTVESAATSLNLPALAAIGR